MDEYRILAPTAILGYGFPTESFRNGMDRKPDLIAVDAGSTDPGPYYLGAGVSFTERQAVKRDLAIILTAALSGGIPVVIGSAGGSGGNPHLDWCRDIIAEIAAEHHLTFTLALIAAEVSPDILLRFWRDGKVTPLPPAPELTAPDIQRAVRIVGQMGPEPIIKALDHDVNVILAGRCYDPAVFAAPAVRLGFERGLAIHLGKILECAAIASTPGSGSDCLFGYLYPDHFEVETLNPNRHCTELSVASHTLYEKSNPYLLPGPGGVLDLYRTRFEQTDPNRVRIFGSVFHPSDAYRIKLEGVRFSGYRTVSIAGTRDPLMIQQIDSVMAGVRERVADNFSGESFDYRLDFKIYGRNGVMGDLEPVKQNAHELGIIIEAVAETGKIADTVCGFARSTMLHYGYPGRVATAGNLAFPYSPSDFHAGAVYEFSLYHLVEVDDPCCFFPMDIVDFSKGRCRRREYAVPTV